MDKYKIGFLHPGEMGISLAVSALHSKQNVYWCSQNRSQASHDRAEQYSLNEIQSLSEFCQLCDIIISICPPHAAKEQACAVINEQYQGIYADCNAISPQLAIDIAALMETAGIDFVDGGIIGLPAWKSASTWLYLSGKNAEVVASCFEKGPLECKVLGPDIGKASALKMCFAANSKGVSALITAILGAAEHYGVREVLEQQWDVYKPGFTLQSKTRIQSVARKAWRFEGEMREIAATLEAAGLPGEFHLGAAEIFSRQHLFKDAEEAPSIEDVLSLCLSTNNDLSTHKKT